MTRILTGLLLGTILSVSACKGQVKAQSETPADMPTAKVENSVSTPVNYRFASTAEAGDILTTMDDHFSNMQAKEMGVRLKDPEAPSLEKLSAQYRAAVMPYSDAETAFLEEVIADSRIGLASMRAYLPDEVLLAKISGDIEGGLPHTRGNLILLSSEVMDGYMKTRETDKAKAHKDLKKLFLHELHHVLSRANQDRMDEYFAIIGFKPCTFTEPEELRSNRLTNPDATSYNHYAPVTVEGTNGLIPYLRVRSAYDTVNGGSMGSYMSFSMLRVDVKDGSCTATDETPQFIGPIPDFMELIGQNTGYIIHPEETLADNFVHYVMETKDLPNPEIPAAVGAFWANP